MIAHPFVFPVPSHRLCSFSAELPEHVAAFLEDEADSMACSPADVVAVLLSVAVAGIRESRQARAARCPGGISNTPRNVSF